MTGTGSHWPQVWRRPPTKRPSSATPALLAATRPPRSLPVLNCGWWAALWAVVLGVVDVAWHDTGRLEPGGGPHSALIVAFVISLLRSTLGLQQK
jgi:hypothetical protein